MKDKYWQIIGVRWNVFYRVENDEARLILREQEKGYYRVCKVSSSDRGVASEATKILLPNARPMNLHGNSQSTRDVHVVRINSVTSNEQRRLKRAVAPSKRRLVTSIRATLRESVMKDAILRIPVVKCPIVASLILLYFVTSCSRSLLILF